MKCASLKANLRLLTAKSIEKESSTKSFNDQNSQLDH